MFPLLSISPPHPAGGKGRGERAAVWCLAAGCQVKLQHYHALDKRAVVYNGRRKVCFGLCLKWPKGGL